MTVATTLLCSDEAKLLGALLNSLIGRPPLRMIPSTQTPHLLSSWVCRCAELICPASALGALRRSVTRWHSVREAERFNHACRAASGLRPPGAKLSGDEDWCSSRLPSRQRFAGRLPWGRHCALWLYSLLFNRWDQIKGIINKTQEPVHCNFGKPCPYFNPTDCDQSLKSITAVVNTLL